MDTIPIVMVQWISTMMQVRVTICVGATRPKGSITFFFAAASNITEYSSNLSHNITVTDQEKCPHDFDTCVIIPFLLQLLTQIKYSWRLSFSRCRGNIYNPPHPQILIVFIRSLTNFQLSSHQLPVYTRTTTNCGSEGD